MSTDFTLTASMRMGEICKNREGKGKNKQKNKKIFKEVVYQILKCLPGSISAVSIKELATIRK